MNRTPAVIFDFGNVIAHFDYRKACDVLGRRHGLSGEALLERARALGLTPLVQRYESGRMTAEAFSESVCRLVGLDMPHDEFAAAWSDIFWPNEPVARLVEQLKRGGYPLVLGSNTNDLHAAQFRRQFADTLSLFDQVVLSFEIGHIKPAEEFYLACARAARRPPPECVFIDDMPENVDGARAAGLSGILFRDVPALRDDLAALGIDVPTGADAQPPMPDRNQPTSELPS